MLNSATSEKRNFPLLEIFKKETNDYVLNCLVEVRDLDLRSV